MFFEISEKCFHAQALGIFYKYLSKTYFDQLCRCTGRKLIFMKYVSVLSLFVLVKINYHCERQDHRESNKNI